MLADSASRRPSRSNSAAEQSSISLTKNELAERIKRRGRSFEEGFDRAYLEELIGIYSDYFHEYSAAPLLVIDSSEIDFVHDEREQDHLIAAIREHQGGVEYYKPLGS